jgi:hypothetical protein
MDNEHYRRAIIAIVRHAGGKILGSKLGFLLKKEFDWAAVGQGMTTKSFVLEHAKDCLEIKSPPGEDVEYVLLNHEADAGWAIFKNPNLPGIVVVRDQKQLIGLKSEEEKDPHDTIIERLTSEDQKNVMRQFAQQKVGDDQATDLLTAIEEEGYWKRFSNALKKKGLVAEWASFRHTNNVESLRQRLAGVHISEENVEEIVRVALTTGSSVKGTRNFRSFASDQKAYRTIQELASAIVLEMTDEQLSNLNLPLGKIWEALRKEG